MSHKTLKKCTWKFHSETRLQQLHSKNLPRKVHARQPCAYWPWHNDTIQTDLCILTMRPNDYTSDSLVHTDHDLMTTRQTVLGSFFFSIKYWYSVKGWIIKWSDRRDYHLTSLKSEKHEINRFPVYNWIYKYTNKNFILLIHLYIWLIFTYILTYIADALYINDSH